MEEVAGIKEAFDSIDTSKAGKINMEQLRVALHKLGHHIPDADLQILMQAVKLYFLQHSIKAFHYSNAIKLFSPKRSLGVGCTQCYPC